MSIRATTGLLLALACGVPAGLAIIGSGNVAVAQQRDPRFGTWQRSVTDTTGSTTITLDLREGGTYTKTLHAILRGHTFDGSEKGTWTADGPVVLLSGDGSAGPSRHDLRNYQKTSD